MKISREARRSARELLHLSMPGGRLDRARIAEISSALVDQRPRGFFAILKEYSRLVRLELEKRHAVIESATELDAQSAKNLSSAIHSKFGEDFTTEFRVTPTLVGGLRIQVGSDVWDGSIAAKLAKLQSLVSNG
jgi:F-type H+-transporting ATPase subunit delta